MEKINAKELAKILNDKKIMHDQVKHWDAILVRRKLRYKNLRKFKCECSAENTIYLRDEALKIFNIKD